MRPRTGAIILIVLALVLAGANTASILEGDHWWPIHYPIAGSMIGFGLASAVLDEFPNPPEPVQWIAAGVGFALGFATNWLATGQWLGGAYGV